jgi:predicted dehydrogenase
VPTKRPKLRIGLIGCGKVAENRHFPALAAVEEAELVALADTDPAALQRAADKHRVARCYRDYRELLDQTDIEAVGVLVDLEHHHEVAGAVLESGRHLLLEKPLAMSLDEADRLVELARDSGRVALMAFNARWHPLVRRAREQIRSGQLGPVGLIGTALSTCHHQRYIPPWRRVRTRGGGSLIENGSHSYDLWRYLTGAEIEEVSAVSCSTERCDDEPAVVTALAESGQLFNGLLSDYLPDRNQIDIYARDCLVRVSLYRFDGYEVQPIRSCDGHMKNRLRRAVRLARELPRGLLQLRHGGDFIATFEAEWRNLIRCVQRGGAPDCTLEDGREALRIALAAAESADTGKAVRLSDLRPAGLAAAPARGWAHRRAPSAS